MRFLPGLILFLFVGLPVDAAAQTLPSAPGYTVSAITLGDELVLADGRVLRLEGIAPPFADTGEWRNKAQQALKELALGRELAVEDDSTDRYGRTTAQVYISDAEGHKIWLQGEMLRRGLAFVYPPTGNEARLDDMRSLENGARHAGTGMWGDAAYADIAADKVSNRTGHFVFSSGVVLDTARVKNLVYLNFGEDWRTNLTVVIASHDLRTFRAAHIDPLDLKGKTVRARGWVKRDYGPTITVTNPAQLEILETH